MNDKSRVRSRYESALLNATAYVRVAAGISDEHSMEGECSDCLQIMEELGRLVDDSLNGRKRRLRRAVIRLQVESDE